MYDEQPSLMKKLGIGGAIVGTVTGLMGLGGYAMSTRITERDAAYKTVRGKLVDDDVAPGIKFSDWLPHVDYTKLPKFLQTAQVDASENSNINIRTRERARVYGQYDIMFEIENQDPNFGKIYTELKADEIADILPYIQKFAVPAIINVYKNVSSSTVKPAEGEVAKEDGSISLDDHLKTGSAIKDELQKILDNEGYTYLRIKRVIPSGVGLSSEANRQLEQIVAEERKLDLLKVQGQVADESLAITAKQAKVTGEALEALRESGVPDDQLIQAYYLQLLRDGGKVGQPFVPGPIPGTGVGAVPSGSK